MTTVAAAAAVTEPFDAWGRAALRVRAWAARHAELVQHFMLMRAVLTSVAVVVVVVALVVSPDLREGSRVYLSVYWLLILWFWLCRSKTVSWRFVAAWFAGSVVWSLVVARVTYTLALRATEFRASSITIAGDVRQDGPSVAIAAVGEECLKILPLVVCGVLATRRVARWTGVDFLLLGVTSGLAFQGCEDTLRRVAAHTLKPGLYQVLHGADYRGPGSGYPQYGIWPTSGWSSVPGGATFPGHHVTTGLIAAGIGVGVSLARIVGRRSTVLVPLCIAPALVAIWIAIGVHAGNNATTAIESQDWRGNTNVPWLIRSGWAIGWHGRYLALVLLVMLVVTLLLDGYARRRSEGAARMTTPSELGVIVRYFGTDVVEVVRAHAHRAGEPRLVALVRGRDEAAAMRGRWAVDTPESARWRRGVWALRAAAMSSAVALVVTVLVVAPGWSKDIGTSLLVHNPWLAGVFDSLGSWWHQQSTATQLLLIAAVAALIVLSGGSLSMALFTTGIFGYLAEHGHGVADLIRDPRAAVRSYLATATPQSVLLDTVELGLTFIPAGVGAKAGQLTRAELERSLEAVAKSRRVILRSQIPRDAVGGMREEAVAEITGGRVLGAPGKPGLKVVKPNVGSTDVDVIGPHGEYIAVGGWGKGIDTNLTRRFQILKYAADQQGVAAQAYFEAGTPRAAIEKAIKVLGADNVFLFELV